jgi:NADH dehydrogenase
MSGRRRVVVIGGGFGGLYLVKSLRRAPVDITLIDRRNHHLFQPLLYQVATGGLSPANIAAPLRGILSRQENARVLLGEAAGVDAARRRVRMRDGADVPYDTLVIATGVINNYFGNDHWEQRAPGLKSIEDATRIRAQILYAFEAAERETDPQRRRDWLTFVIIGAGPTGVELAGAVAEIARNTLRHDFRTINPADAHVILLDAANQVLPGYPDDLSASAAEQLRELNVDVRTGLMVQDIRPDAVVVGQGEARERIPARTTLWAAGVRASAMGRVLASATDCELDRGGRIIVEADCSIPGYPDIFVIGDLAHSAHQGDKPLPGIAPVAMQQGKYVARLIRARVTGKAVGPFRYRHKGDMATIGRARAVADLGRWHVSGYFAWLAWLFVHLVFLIEFQNRVLVLIQWAWNYITFNRAARLITGEGVTLDDVPPDELPQAAASNGTSRGSGPAVPVGERGADG